MKKVVMMTVVVILVIAMASTAFAAGSIIDPTSGGTNSSSNTIDAYGYVGPDGTINPGVPPTVTTINASIPTQMLWAAYASDFTGGSAPLTSANHYVVCNSGSADLDVTVASFTSAGGGALPGTSTLALNLGVTAGTGTPNVVASSITGLIGTTSTKIAELEAGDSVNMTFNGTYSDTGVFPSTAIQPKYEMVLKLDAV